MSFSYRGLECKSRKSRDPWSKRQFWPWSTNEAGQRLTEFCQEKALVIANIRFQQHKRRLYTWTSSDGQYRNWTEYSMQPKMEKLYAVRKTRPGAQSGPTLCNPMDCSSPGSSVHGVSPGKNTGVGCHDLLQGIFPTQLQVSPTSGSFFTS